MEDHNQIIQVSKDNKTLKAILGVGDNTYRGIKKQRRQQISHEKLESNENTNTMEQYCPRMFFKMTFRIRQSSQYAVKT